MAALLYVPLVLTFVLIFGRPAAAQQEATGATPDAAQPRSVGLKQRAVDGLNANLEALGGELSGRGLYGTRASFAVPLGDALGLQVDGLYGKLGGSALYGLGAHAFWRDPSSGLIGLYVAHTKLQRLGGMVLNHFGAEGELYRGPITFRAIAGWEKGNSGRQTGGGVTESFSIPSRPFGRLSATYYVQENLALSAGAVYLSGKLGASLSSEWALPFAQADTLTSLFLEAFAGTGKFHGVWAGIKIYFGRSAKSLMRRHREDDPLNYMNSVGVLAEGGGTRTSEGGGTAAAAPAAPAGPACPPGFALVGGVCLAI